MRKLTLTAAAAACVLLALGAWMPQPLADIVFNALAAVGGPRALAPGSTDQAIVVLGGERERGPKAAAVSTLSGLPLYIACCNLEPVVIRAGAQPTWVESVSSDTQTNALVAACTLLPAGITRVALVTDRYHMARASLWFSFYGFKVTPVPSEVPPSESRPSAKRGHARHELAGIVEVGLSALTRPFLHAPCTLIAKKSR